MQAGQEQSSGMLHSERRRTGLTELIDLELLILGGMGIVEGPLLERDISADKVDQPAVLLIKLMA